MYLELLSYKHGHGKLGDWTSMTHDLTHAGCFKPQVRYSHMIDTESRKRSFLLIKAALYVCYSSTGLKYATSSK